jgi:hypothetical protein
VKVVVLTEDIKNHIGARRTSAPFLELQNTTKFQNSLKPEKLSSGIAANAGTDGHTSTKFFRLWKTSDENFWRTLSFSNREKAPVK